MKPLNLRTFGMLMAIGVVALGGTTLPTDAEANFWHKFKHFFTHKIPHFFKHDAGHDVEKVGKVAVDKVLKPIGETAFNVGKDTVGKAVTGTVGAIQGGIQAAGQQAQQEISNQLQGGGGTQASAGGKKGETTEEEAAATKLEGEAKLAEVVA